MPHIPNADHQMKSIILALMALFSFSIYNAIDSYNVVRLTEAQQQEDQVGILSNNSTTSPNATSNATSLTPTELFSRVQDSVVQVTTTNRDMGGLINSGLGSGFIYDKNGHIITNYHVVALGSTVRIILRQYIPFQ